VDLHYSSPRDLSPQLYTNYTFQPKLNCIKELCLTLALKMAHIERKTVPVVNCAVSFLRTVLASLLVRYHGRQWGHLTSTLHLDQIVADVMGQRVPYFNQLCDGKKY